MAVVVGGLRMFCFLSSVWVTSYKQCVTTGFAFFGDYPDLNEYFFHIKCMLKSRKKQARDLGSRFPGRAIQDLYCRRPTAE